MASAYDVTVGGVGLMLYDDAKTGKKIRFSWVPVDAQRAGTGTEDRVWADWSNGLGYSRPGTGIANGYSYGVNVDTRSPGLVLPAGAITELAMPVSMTGFQTPADSFVLNGDLYFLMGRYAVKLTGGIGPAEAVYSLASDAYEFTRAAVVDRGGTPTAYVGHGPGSGGFTRLSGSTWTTTTSFYRGHVQPVWLTTTQGVSVRHLVAAVDNYTVKKCALTDDPMVDGNWGPSGGTVVGEGVHKIRSICTAGRHFYVATEGGLYDHNELDESLALTPYMTDLTDIENGLRTQFYDRYVMFAGSNYLDAIDVSQNGLKHPYPSFATPGAIGGLPNETPIWGRPTALTTDSGWLVAAFFNNDHSYVCYGMPRRKLGIEGPGEWVWHGAMSVFENQHVAHLRVRTVTENGIRGRRLYIATIPENGGTARLFWQSLPRSQSAYSEYDRLAGGSVEVSHRFAPGFTIYMTPSDWGEPNREKTAVRADVTSRNLGSGNSLSVTLLADGETTATVDPVGSATISPSQALPISTDPPNGQTLQPVVTAVSTATTPAMLRALTIRAAINRELAEVYEMDVLIGRGQKLAHGGPDEQTSPKTTYEQVWALQNTVTTARMPWQTSDESYVVLVEPGMAGEMVQAERGEQASRRAWVQKMVMRLRVLDRPALYEISDYNSVDRYS